MQRQCVGIGSALLFATSVIATAAQAQGIGPPAQIEEIDEQPGVEPGAVEIEPAYQRQTVFYRTSEPPGTVIVRKAVP